MIASPGDVQEIRDLVPPLFTQWNSRSGRRAILVPVMWEHGTVPELGRHPQDIVDQQLIADSDLLVAVFWSRIGSPTAKSISGTIQEIETFISSKGARRVMVYFIDKAVPVRTMDLDLVQLQQLKDYRKKLEKEGLLCSVPDESEFKFKLYQHLESKVEELLNHQLPLPQNQFTSLPVAEEVDDFRWPCDGTIVGVASALDKNWLEMSARSDKFRDDGGRLAARFARAIDQLLVTTLHTLTPTDKAMLRECSHGLKQLNLNARSKAYRELPTDRYWKDGAKIAQNLLVHVRFENQSDHHR